jgi:mono/diheme cytochrome c family protein/DNA-binding beta-propeller fold protein YncE
MTGLPAGLLGALCLVVVLLSGGVGCGRDASAGALRAPRGSRATTESGRAGAEGGHARPRALALDAREDLLYVALSTADRLAVLDVSGGGARTLAELPLCAFPDALAALPAGGIVVACRLDPDLRVVTREARGPGDQGGGATGVSPTADFRVRIVEAGPEHGHQGLAIHPGGRYAYVASPARGGVEVVDLSIASDLPREAADGGGPHPPRFFETGLFPKSVRLLPAAPEVGQPHPLLLVSNFIGHTVTIHDLSGDGGTIAPARQTLTTQAPVLDLVATPVRGATRPAYPDDLGGALLLATHEDRVLSRENLAVEGLDSVVLVLPRAPPGQTAVFVDAGPGRRRSINLTERDLAPLVGLDALAVDTATGALAVVGAGSDNVLVGSPRVATLLGGPVAPVGANPSAVAFLRDGRTVTADRLSDTLSFVSSAPAVVRTFEIGGNVERRSRADLGELLFYSRALLPHNVSRGPLSIYTCAACHADGHIDGRRHPSKRNRFYSMTKTCRGLVGTEPFLSLGEPATFAAFADNIVATHAQGALDAPETFDRYPVELRLRQGEAWTSVTISPQKVRGDLAAYLAAIPVEKSPFVAPGRRALTPAERRGLSIFRADCSGCHQLVRSTGSARNVPPSELEARLLAGEVALTSPRRYDVGTPVLGEGGNNPPSLRGLWAAAPYFSDGSARRLEDVLRRTNPQAARIHAAENARLPPTLSADSTQDLLAFLRAL